MSVCKALSASIHAWKQRRRNASLGLLAKHSQVSYSTIRRIAANECSPSFEKAIAIAAVTMDHEDLTRFLKEHFPTYTLVPNLYKPIDAKGIQEFLLLKDHASIIARAATNCGTSVDQIKTTLGTDGIRALKELVSENIVEEREDGKIFATDTMFAIANPKNILGQIVLWARNFNYSNLGKPSAVTYFFATEGLNESGYQALIQARMRHNQEVLDIFSKPEYRGNIVAYTAEFSNMLDD